VGELGGILATCKRAGEAPRPRHAWLSLHTKCRVFAHGERLAHLGR
jgi:hypothetical protein